MKCKKLLFRISNNIFNKIWNGEGFVDSKTFFITVRTPFLNILNINSHCGIIVVINIIFYFRVYV